MSNRIVEVRITGRVQGVWFRAWCEHHAYVLGLRGWVKNNPDSSVSALFSGSATAVAEMLQMCETGPRAARVENVEIVEEGGTAPAMGFEVLR